MDKIKKLRRNFYTQPTLKVARLLYWSRRKWPCYPYVRYYWYPCHFYSWYGPCPPEYVITGDTYNYYYYGDSNQRVQVPDYSALEKPPEGKL